MPPFHYMEKYICIEVYNGERIILYLYSTFHGFTIMHQNNQKKVKYSQICLFHVPAYTSVSDMSYQEVSFGLSLMV